MEVPLPILNLIDHANAIGKGSTDRTFHIEAVMITPVAQIQMQVPNGFARYCQFGANYSDDVRIRVHIQPGVYQGDILPYKDNLFMEVVKREGYNQTVYRYRCTPLGDTNVSMEGSATSLSNLRGKDNLNLVTLTFQLMETGYSILKNQMISDIMPMCSLFNAMHTQFTKYGKTLNLTDGDAWRGVDIEEPIDNDRIFQQVVIPSAVPLISFGRWLQNHDEFGVYATGLGTYYRKGMWYIFPLFRLGRFETARAVLEVYRIPQDVMPTVKNSYFVNGRSVTILSTGGAEHEDGTDIDRQNRGTGARIVSSDAVMNDVGRYVGKGQALTTRQDSLSEFQTASRSSGEEIIPFNKNPSNNLCKQLSKNALADGTIITVSWHNSDCDLIVPGMPVRYYFIYEEVLVYKEGTVLTIRSEDQMDTENIPPVFREHSSLELYLNNEEVTATP